MATLPNLGDAEIKAIYFDNQDVVLSIKLPMSTEMLVIRLTRVRSLALTRSSTQNVIDDVLLTDLGPNLRRLEIRPIPGAGSFFMADCQDVVVERSGIAEER